MFGLAWSSLRLGPPAGRRGGSGAACSIPGPRPAQETSRSTGTRSRLLTLPCTGPRWHGAVVHLEDTFAAWSVPVHLARRWLRPARELFTAHDAAELELFVQLDAVEQLVSIELWGADGTRLFGSEACLREPELAREEPELSTPV